MSWRCSTAVTASLFTLGLVWASQPPTLVTVRGGIIDGKTNKPLPARIYIQDARGKFYFPKSASPKGSAVEYRKQRPNAPQSVEMHTTLSAHPFTVNLPLGTYTVTIERGHEYFPLVRKLVVENKPHKETFKLQRYINMAEMGWYSGETHVHRSLEELPNAMLADDLNVALPLLYWVTKAYTPPRGGDKSTNKEPPAKVIKVDKTHVIYPRNTEYEIFTVGGKRHTLGAFFILNHKSIFDKGTPPVRPIAEQAHQEDALLELDKPNWPWSMMLVPVMGIDLFELSNNHVWRTKFGFPQFGLPPADFMNIEKDENGMTENGWIDFNFQNYYTLLNCGFRLRPTAGTASGVHPVPLGFGRVYVYCGNDFSYENWIKGLDAGRSMVTTGPMLMVKVNDELPGHTFEQQGTKKYKVVVSTKSAEPIEAVEIIVNGKTAKRMKPDHQHAEKGASFKPFTVDNWSETFDIDSTSWIAVRCFEKRANGRKRFAHSGPVHIDVEGKPLVPRKEEIQFLIQRVEDQLKRNTGVLPESSLQEYRDGLEIYRKIAKRASN